MNYAKIAAALHALADAFLEGTDEPAKPAKGGKKTAAVEPAPTVAPATTVAAPAPVVPTVTKEQLNKSVLKVAAKNRDRAEAILAEHGTKSTVTLPPEKWQAVFDAFEEEIAKMDAATVQVQQASLV